MPQINNGARCTRGHFEAGGSYRGGMESIESDATRPITALERGWTRKPTHIPFLNEISNIFKNQAKIIVIDAPGPSPGD